MQKQKINYLVLQSSYDQIEISLFEDSQKIRDSKLSKFTASSGLIPLIQSTLEQENLMLKDLNFICANTGPAPFTTLRTTIVTVNGIGYTTNLPLVGVNGLQTFTKQVMPDCQNVAVILNAFNRSVYFGIRSAGQVTYGWQPIDRFINHLKTIFGSQPVIMIGQGLSSYTPELQILPSNFIIDFTGPQFPNIDLIAQAGLILYLEQKTQKALAPLYLKQAEPFN